jgi:outer membrane immunogenic protein
MMKISLAAAAASMLFAGAASAADMAVKAPSVVAPPVVSWTGFYVGANVGGAWDNGNSRFVDWTLSGFDPGPAFGRTSSTSVVGGVHGGFNWQLSPTWLLGVEADWDWASLGRTNAAALNAGGVPFFISNTSVSDRIRGLGSVRGRAGFLVNNSVLLYGTGGAAWADQRYSGFLQPNGPASASYSESSNKTGWVAGAGVEGMFAGRWLLRAEWLHYSFDGSRVAVPCAQLGCPGTGFVTYGRNDVDTVRVGVSYLFGGFGGPVVAKY